MHPVVPLTAISWAIVLSIATIAYHAGPVALDRLQYQDASPRIAIAFICLAISVEAFVRVLTRAAKSPVE